MLFRLKRGIEFHMYMNKAPCGNCNISRKKKAAAANGPDVEAESEMILGAAMELNIEPMDLECLNCPDPEIGDLMNAAMELEEENGGLGNLLNDEDMMMGKLAIEPKHTSFHAFNASLYSMLEAPLSWGV